MLVAFLVTFLGLGGYTLLAAAVQYFEMQELIEAAVVESSHRRRLVTTMQRTVDGREIARDVRAGILERARRMGLVLPDERLVVTPSDQGVTVLVEWAQPALSLVGRGILTVPMSIERRFELRVAR
jgi:hypothetical protein